MDIMPTEGTLAPGKDIAVVVRVMGQASMEELGACAPLAFGACMRPRACISDA